MPLSRVKQREDVFYRLFKEFSTKILEAGETYSKLVHDYPDSAYQISLLKDYEVAGDNCVRSIFTELNTSFITPFDREDIAAIAREMDEVIDNMEGVSARFELYQVTEMREDAIAMCDLTLEAVRELDLMFEAFPNFKKDKTVDEHALRVNDIEDKGDVVYRQALAKLFREDLDALEVVKWRELLSKQEHALDACKNVTNAVSGVVMKNA